VTRTLHFERVDGLDGVRLEEHYGFSLHITTNGWQWSGVPVNQKTLELLKEAIAVAEEVMKPSADVQNAAI